MTITDRDFRRITDFFYSHTGNSLPDHKHYLVEHRLTKIVGDGQKYPDLKSLLTSLEKNPRSEDAAKVVSLLTTHYSFFFREPEHFTFYQRFLMKASKSLDEIRIWSAACSTGEEPYSLAMSSILACPDHLDKVKILATDISSDSLSKAKQGIYNLSSLQEVFTDRVIQHFFTESNQNQREVKEYCKKLIRFRNLNLMGYYPFKKQFHIIFLRNVLFYMNEVDKREIIERTSRTLLPGGYLIMGRMDAVDVIGRGFKHMGDSIYKKLS